MRVSFTSELDAACLIETPYQRTPRCTTQTYAKNTMQNNVRTKKLNKYRHSVFSPETVGSLGCVHTTADLLEPLVCDELLVNDCTKV